MRADKLDLLRAESSIELSFRRSSLSVATWTIYWHSMKCNEMTISHRSFCFRLIYGGQLRPDLI